jgi:hypothetical protein
MAVTYQTTHATPSIGGNFTALAYNPDVSQYVYASYSGFVSTPMQVSANMLYILDPDNNYSLVHDIDLGTSLGTDSAREIALDEDGNLFIGTFGSKISYVPAAALAAGTDNTSVVWYDSRNNSNGFNGLDIGFGVEDPALQGDYNEDGSVDAADYVVWRKSPSQYGGDPGGYTTWATNFGETGPGSGGGGAVPEPASITMLLIGLTALGFRRRAA